MNEVRVDDAISSLLHAAAVEREKVPTIETEVAQLTTENEEPRKHLDVEGMVEQSEAPLVVAHSNDVLGDLSNQEAYHTSIEDESENENVEGELRF